MKRLKQGPKSKCFLAIALPVLSAFATMGATSCDPPGHDYTADVGSVFLACRAPNSCETSRSQPRPLSAYSPYSGILFDITSNAWTTELGWYHNPDNRPLEAFFPAGTPHEEPKRKVLYSLSNSGTYSLSVNSRGFYVIDSVRQNDQDEQHIYPDRGEDIVVVRVQTVDSWPQSSVTLRFRYNWI